MTLLAAVLFAAAAYYAEKDVPGSPFVSIPEAMWWAICTMTTVGYGDISPSTGAGKFIGALTVCIGVIILAIPAGIFISEFMNMTSERKRDKAMSKEGATVNEILEQVEVHVGRALTSLQEVRGIEQKNLNVLNQNGTLDSDDEAEPEPEKPERKSLASSLIYGVIRRASRNSKKSVDG